MPGKLKGKAIQPNSIPSIKLQGDIAEAVDAGVVPKIASLSYPNDDTAADPANNNTYILNGSGFAQNAVIYIGNTLASTVTHTNSNSVGFTIASNTPLGVYNLFFVNPDGGVAVYPNFEVSSAPVWVTGQTLASFQILSPISYQLVATSDTPVTYTLQAGSSLPGGITLSANGLLSGTLNPTPASTTTYTFTVLATDQENQSSARQFSVTGSSALELVKSAGPATGSFTIPFGVSVIRIYGTGGGGNGGGPFGSSGSTGGGGGGGGGAESQLNGYNVSVNVGETYNYVIANTGGNTTITTSTGTIIFNLSGGGNAAAATPGAGGQAGNGAPLGPYGSHAGGSGGSGGIRSSNGQNANSVIGCAGGGGGGGYGDSSPIQAGAAGGNGGGSTSPNPLFPGTSGGGGGGSGTAGQDVLNATAANVSALQVYHGGGGGAGAGIKFPSISSTQYYGGGGGGIGGLAPGTPGIGSVGVLYITN